MKSLINFQFFPAYTALIEELSSAYLAVEDPTFGTVISNIALV